MNEPIVKIEFKSNKETLEQVYSIYLKSLSDVIDAAKNDKEMLFKIKDQLQVNMAKIANHIGHINFGPIKERVNPGLEGSL